MEGILPSLYKYIPTTRAHHFAAPATNPGPKQSLPSLISLAVPVAPHVSKLFDPKMANRHTIILMQSSQNRSSRTFMDFDAISHAMDGICGLYERKLKELNPTIRNITYDISDLFNFIDGLADLSALIFDHSIQAYLPYDRQWIKQRIFQHLKKLASH